MIYRYIFISPSIYIHPSIYTHPSGKKSFTLPCVLEFRNMVTTWGPLTSAEISQITIALCSALVVNVYPALTLYSLEESSSQHVKSANEAVRRNVYLNVSRAIYVSRPQGKESSENHEKSKSLSSSSAATRTTTPPHPAPPKRWAHAGLLTLHLLLSVHVRA